MKITVLLFQPDPETGPVLADALGSAGIRVCRKRSLSGMHHQLSSRHFDAILVGREVLARYGVAPSRHLWKSRSPNTIMAFSISTGECAIKTWSLPQDASGVPDRSEKEAVLNFIEAALRKALAPGFPGCRALPAERPVSRPPQGASLAASTPGGALPFAMPVLSVPLQQKPARLLDSLVQAGPSGAGLGDISLKLWGTTVPDRKKDIQIYVSRVRRALENSSPQRYRIRLSGDRYFLVDTVA